MFKKEYQGGSHVIVLSTQGRDPTGGCKLTGSVSLRYDKSVRGYVHVLDGDSISTRIQLPANDRSSLGLQQPFLVLQVAIEKDARFSVELCVQDGKGGRRRVNFSSSVKEPSISTLIARVPFVSTATGQWCNVCFDLPSLMSELFPGHTHKSLESLVVGGACLIRRVFTMKERPRGSDDLVSGEGARDIPPVCQLVVDHTPIPTHVISSVTKDHRKTTSDRSGSVAEPQWSDHPPTHVAFGKKVAIPDHVLARQAADKSSGKSRKKTQTSGVTSSRHSSAPTTAVRGVVGVAGAGLGGRSQPQSRKSLRGDEQPTLNVIGVQQLSLRGAGPNVKGAEPSTSGRSFKVLESRPEPVADLELGHTSYYLDSSREGEEEGEGEGDQVFSYFSPPRSAGSSHTPSVHTLTTLTQGTTHTLQEAAAAGREGSRSVNLDKDFLHDNTAIANEQGLPRDNSQSEEEEIVDDVVEKGIPLASGTDGGLNQTRLSDDYDWRQYQTPEDTPLPPHSPNSAHPQFQIDHHGNNSTPEPDTSTLSTMEKPAAHSLLDSLDTRGMGGALSPEGNQSNQSNGSEEEEEEEMELMYDPQLHCFYDPTTLKYYELIQ